MRSSTNASRGPVVTPDVKGARELMARSRAEQFAVGAFNVDNQETLLSIVRAAKAMSAPVLAELSHAEAELIGLANLRSLVDNYRAEHEVEIYLNLDHSPSVEAAKAGIDAGFEFVHVDYSQANKHATDAQIVAASREVVQYAARTTGALVESEPHYFAGSSNLHMEVIDYEELRKTFSSPQGARAFVAATGVATFAAAIGNLHGRYPVPKRLDLELLARIRDAIDVNISLHGSSGTAADDLRSAARSGVSKINVNSDLRYAYRTSLERQLREHPDQYALAKLLGPVIGAVQNVVEEKISLFGSSGKALPPLVVQTG
jgi:fructose-bisphosphate aldolase class II